MPSVEQQIEQSRAKKKALIKKSILGFFVVLFVGVAGVLLVSFLPTVSNEAKSPMAQTDNATQSNNRETPNPQVTEFSEAERKALQVALSESKQRVTGLVQRVSQSRPFAVKAGQIEASLNQAFNEYGASNYGEVTSLLNDIDNNTAALNKEYEQAYTAPYEKALNAFNNNNNSEAFNLNRQSLNINPDFEQAKILQQRIDVFNQVQDAYEQARVGKVENNVNKQREAYRKIIALDPYRSDAKQALATIDNQLKNSRFNGLLAKANDAITQQNYAAAKQYLKDAKSINGSSRELETISKKLNTLVASEEQNKIEKQVTLFARADEWQTVALLSNKGLSSFPTSPILQQAKQNAEAILSTAKRLKEFQQRPERLTDNTVRSLAQQEVDDAHALAQKSPKLLAQIRALEEVMDDVNTPRDVTITSDNDTYIKVLGVGLVGEVKRKTIKLKPGTYRIEGSRDGYRSTIREIEVSPSATNLSVHIACTEKV